MTPQTAAQLRRELSPSLEAVCNSTNFTPMPAALPVAISTTPASIAAVPAPIAAVPAPIAAVSSAITGRPSGKLAAYSAIAAEAAKAAQGVSI
jgi:hypothetical protein